MTEVNVRVPGLTFWGGAGQDGFYIRGGGLDGLLDGVDVRRGKTNRQGDGAFPGRSKLDARIVTIGGPCIAGSAEVLDHRASQLKGLQSIRDGFQVVFDMPGKTVWGTAFVSDKPGFKPTMWGTRANWDLELQFDDPILYGESRSFPATAQGVSFSLYHYGNTPSPALFTIAGNYPGGYTLNFPGGLKFQVTQPVAAGSPHTVDMDDGYVRINGSIVFGKTPFADTVQVPNGGSLSVTLTAPSGTGTVTPLVTDRYI